jgi:hypothetical protein
VHGSVVAQFKRDFFWETLGHIGECRVGEIGRHPDRHAHIPSRKKAPLLRGHRKNRRLAHVRFTPRS